MVANSCVVLILPAILHSAFVGLGKKIIICLAHFDILRIVVVGIGDVR